jgi:hypothetical protein
MPSLDKKVHGPEFFQNPAAEESDLMQNANEISTKTLMPVFNVSGCVGHILKTARGFRACDANDKLVGIYPTAGEGIIALLNAANDAA